VTTWTSGESRLPGKRGDEVEKHPIYAELESAGKGVAQVTMERVRAVVASARRVVRLLIVAGRGSEVWGARAVL
jgi:hypothetical protein